MTLGEHNLKEKKGTEQVIGIRDWINHPDWDRMPKGSTNDFAIIKLVSHVSFSLHILPVCLPSISKNYDDVIATVSGFGRTTCSGNLEDELQKVTIKTVKCEETDHDPSHITPNMLCAALPGKHASAGDSGGPLVTEEGGYFSVIGVVSWGYQCKQPTKELPGVYARVTSQLDWISGHISGKKCAKPNRKR